MAVNGEGTSIQEATVIPDWLGLGAQYDVLVEATRLPETIPATAPPAETLHYRHPTTLDTGDC